MFNIHQHNANTLRGLILFFCCILSQCLAEDVSWEPIAVISNSLDGLIHNGSSFVGFRMTPTLQLYCSTYGTNWTEYNSSWTPIAIGHDSQGTLYSLTTTGQCQSLGCNYSVHLWSSTNYQDWHYLAEFRAPFGVIPQSGGIMATETILLVKLRTIAGPGWWSGAVPHPVYAINRSDPTNAVKVSNGESLDNFFCNSNSFIATRDTGFAEYSTNGTNWTEIFSLGNSNPPNGIVALWESLFFIHGYWVNLAVRNEISSQRDLNIPANFSHGLKRLYGVVYDGHKLIVAGDDVCYVSTDYTQTWSTNNFTSVCAFSHNDDTYLICDKVDSNTMIYKLSCPTNTAVNMQAPSLEINITSGQELELHPSSNQVYQIECSKDLTAWHLYGIPTTNNPLRIPTRSFDSESLYFRTRKLQDQ